MRQNSAAAWRSLPAAMKLERLAATPKAVIAWAKMATGSASV
jgi:hypothetical protein